MLTPSQKHRIGTAAKKAAAEFVGPMSYSSVFTLTCAVMESLEP